jgi:acetolactate synthase-1/2/3 large subunit
MKLSDYVAKKVVELGIKNVFMVTGGGSMHLNHSLGTNKDIACNAAGLNLMNYRMS